MTIDPLYSLSGAVVGLVVGLTGVGGGSLMTPVLVLLFGIHPVSAVGVDLLYAAVTKSAGSIVHSLRGNVDWRVVRRLATGSVPASAATLAILFHYDIHSAQTARLVTTSLGVALLLTATSVLFRDRLLALRAEEPADAPERGGLATILVGALLGVLVSISSVGAGAIGVTALLLLYPRIPVVKIVGSDIAHAVPLTFVAGVGHWAHGTVDANMLVSLLTGSIPGIVIGARIAPAINEKALRALLTLVLAIVGVRLILA